MQLADFRKADGRGTGKTVSHCGRHQNITAALERTPDISPGAKKSQIIPTISKIP